MAYVGVKPAGISSASQVETNLLNVDNVTIDGNTISSTDTNGNITLDPDGTGDLIVASGNVGIGESSPADKIHSSGDIRLTSGASTTRRMYALAGSGAYALNSSGGAAIAFHRDGSNNDEIAFETHAQGASHAERMRITSGGDLLHGTTTAEGVGYTLQYNGGAPRSFFNKNYSGTATAIYFMHNGSVVGSITYSNTATAYNTSSDHRLKQDVVNMTGAIDRVKALSPKRFSWIDDADTTVDGFLAHEAQAVVPEAVTGTHNEVDEDGNAVMQGIDQSKLVPLLTGALQEAIAKIETLEAKVTALENA